jgi:hypothetical protein
MVAGYGRRPEPLNEGRTLREEKARWPEQAGPGRLRPLKARYKPEPSPLGVQHVRRSHLVCRS